MRMQILFLSSRLSGAHVNDSPATSGQEQFEVPNTWTNRFALACSASVARSYRSFAINILAFRSSPAGQPSPKSSHARAARAPWPRLTPEELTAYRRATGALLWGTGQTLPYLACATTSLARRFTCAMVHDLAVANKIIATAKAALWQDGGPRGGTVLMGRDNAHSRDCSFPRRTRKQGKERHA